MKTQSLLNAVSHETIWPSETQLHQYVRESTGVQEQQGCQKKQTTCWTDGWSYCFVLWLIHKDEEPTLKSLLETSEAFSYWTHLQYELLINTQHWENRRQFFQGNAEREMTQQRSPGYFCEDELQASLAKKDHFLIPLSGCNLKLKVF